VDGRRVTVPSFLVRPGQSVGVAQGSRALPHFASLAGQTPGRGTPGWLEYQPDALTGRVLTLPARDDIDVPVHEQLIVEYYSR
jgi:small subunit ribosomal protein S4